VAGRRKLDDRGARHDRAWRRAKDEGFAARAVYKLQEIDKRFRLLGAGKRVLDLGCWPGSWLQYAAERVGDEGVVVGVDLRALEIAVPGWCESVVADVESLDTGALVERFGELDVVLSDMAPHTTGDRASDQWKSEELFRRALAIASATLRPGGHFVAKVFQGGEFAALLRETKAAFSEVKAVHAEASRTSSAEQYVVGRGLKVSARTRAR
jgi:23S rRNA (uridine2552-2'-O)-methyltransferase